MLHLAAAQIDVRIAEITDSKQQPKQRNFTRTIQAEQFVVLGFFLSEIGRLPDKVNKNKKSAIHVTFNYFLRKLTVDFLQPEN